MTAHTRQALPWSRLRRNNASGRKLSNMGQSSTRLRGTNAPRPTNAPATERSAAESFAAVVTPFSSGELAQAASRSKETAKGWKSGRACPNASSLINLARKIPSVREWLYSEIEPGALPETQDPKVLNVLYGALQNLAGKPDGEGDAARAILRAMSGGQL